MESVDGIDGQCATGGQYLASTTNSSGSFGTIRLCRVPAGASAYGPSRAFHGHLLSERSRKSHRLPASQLSGYVAGTAAACLAAALPAMATVPAGVCPLARTVRGAGKGNAQKNFNQKHFYLFPLFLVQTRHGEGGRILILSAAAGTAAGTTTSATSPQSGDYKTAASGRYADSAHR